MTSRFKNILVVGHNNKFIKLLIECLSQRYTVKSKLNLHHIEDLAQFATEAIIFDSLEKRKELKKETQILSKLAVKKIIYLEDASNLYLNSKNVIPYSVYKKLIPKNGRCVRLKNREDTLLKSEAEVVIFRLSELFGKSINSGLIHDLMHKRKVTLTNGKRDFIYDGDVIHAIEVALETDSHGIFDIASGRSVSIKDELIPLIKKHRHNKIKVKFRKKRKTNLIYNCENFKFYKWDSLVSLECGLNVIKRSEGVKDAKVSY